MHVESNALQQRFAPQPVIAPGRPLVAHGVHVESNALQQRFAPQPLLRSSWQQLVIIGLEPDIHLLDSRVKHGNDNKKESPGVTVEKNMRTLFLNKLY